MTRPDDLKGAARAELAEFLGEYGLTGPQSVRPDRVCFSSAELLVCVAAGDYDADPRGIRVDLGRPAADGTTGWVGLWSIVPRDPAGAGYATWQISAEFPWRVALARLREECLGPYAGAYLADPSRLDALLDRQRDVAERRYRSALADRDLARARAAFQAHDYAAAIWHYGQVDELTVTDRKRLDIARRALRPDHGPELDE